MRKLLSLLAISLLAAACAAAGSSGAPGSVTPGSATPGASGPANRYAVETGSDKLILRLTEEGGFVAPGYLLTSVPQFALYGDGRIIVPGPVIAIYPGPLLPNLRQMQIGPVEIQKILEAADAAGLLSPDARYDATNIADAGTAVFTTTVEGKTHVISAYALSESGTTPDAAATAARAKLRAFQDKILNLSLFLGRTISGDVAYDAKGMRVFARPASTTDQSGLTPQVVTWPLAVDPLTAGAPTTNADTRCIAIGGADLQAFLAIARTANAITVWVAPTGRVNVSVRPLYPDESGCAGAN